MMTNFRKIVKCLLLGAFLTGCGNNPQDQTSGTVQTVRFGMLPYGDHSFAIIGVEKGWFKDVNIDLAYSPVKVDAIVPLLNNNQKDVISCPPGILFSSFDNASNLCSFVFSDLFQGYAILANPNQHFKSVEDFISEGQSYDKAVVSAIQQMKGKRFTYPSETAIKPFIDLVLQKGKLRRNQFKSIVLDDPLTVNTMRNGQADFQVGGVPSRLVLQKEGYKPIITSIVIAKYATPSDTSQALSSILQNSWVTSKTYFKDNYPTVLRLASVNYRIMKFINDHPEEAAKIHMAYLSKITGQSFDVQDGLVIYKDLDPFVTFEDQAKWFHDTKDPLYYKYVNGSILNNFVAQGIFKKKPPVVGDVIYADRVYFDLEKLRDSSIQFKTVLIKKGLDKQQSDLFKRANHFFEIYDYFDSKELFEKMLKQ